MNTYYPGISVNAARTQVRRGHRQPLPRRQPADRRGRHGAHLPDTGPEIDASNTDNYGDGIAGGTGHRRDQPRTTRAATSTRWPRARPTAAAIIHGGGGEPARRRQPHPLLRQYFAGLGPTATRGRRTFQVVRVPQYGSATLGAALTASAWNGRAGGVLALDVSGTLALGGVTVSVDGLGFRGGMGRARGGTGGLADTDYRTSVAQNPNGMKGEGIVGTPDLAGTGSETAIPSGDMARGAPGTAGGGGTDGNPAGANDQNSGGGGGANWGGGGQGGHGWLQNDCPPTTGSQTRRLRGHGTAGRDAAHSGQRRRRGLPQQPGPERRRPRRGHDPDPRGRGLGHGHPAGARHAALSTANDGAGGRRRGRSHRGDRGHRQPQRPLRGRECGGQGGYANLASPPAPDAPPATSGSHHGPGGGGGGGRVRLSSAATATSVVGGASGLTNTCRGDSTTQAYGATGGGNGDVRHELDPREPRGRAAVHPRHPRHRDRLVGRRFGPYRVRHRLAAAHPRLQRLRQRRCHGPRGDPLNAEPSPPHPRLQRAGALSDRRGLRSCPATSGSRRWRPRGRAASWVLSTARTKRCARAFEGRVRLRLAEAGIRAAERRERRAARLLARARAVGSSSTGGSASNVPKPARAPGRRRRPRRGRTPSRSRSRRRASCGCPVSDLRARACRRARSTHAGLASPTSAGPCPSVSESGESPSRWSRGHGLHGRRRLRPGLGHRARRGLRVEAHPLGAASARPGFVRVEENNFYAPYLPRDTDPWIWGVASAGWSGGPWTFDLPGLVAGPAGRARAAAGGRGNQPAPPRAGPRERRPRGQRGVGRHRPGRPRRASFPRAISARAGNTVELGVRSLRRRGGGLRARVPRRPRPRRADGPASRPEVAPVRIAAYDPRGPAGSGDYLIVAPGDVLGRPRTGWPRPSRPRVSAPWSWTSSGPTTATAPGSRGGAKPCGHCSRTPTERACARHSCSATTPSIPRGYLGEPPRGLRALAPGLGRRVRARRVREPLRRYERRRPAGAGHRPAARAHERGSGTARGQGRKAGGAAGRGGGPPALRRGPLRGARLPVPQRGRGDGGSRHYAGRRWPSPTWPRTPPPPGRASSPPSAGGATIVHYFGHGAPQAWSNSTLLNAGRRGAARGGGRGGGDELGLRGPVVPVPPRAERERSRCCSRRTGVRWRRSVRPVSPTPACSACSARRSTPGSSGVSPLGEAIRRGKAEALKKDPRRAPWSRASICWATPRCACPGRRGADARATLRSRPEARPWPSQDPRGLRAAAHRAGAPRGRRDRGRATARRSVVPGSGALCAPTAASFTNKIRSGADGERGPRSPR